MRKKIESCSYKEFCNWANQRCADGAWSMDDAITALKVVRLVELHLLKERFWSKAKYILLDVGAEIEIN